MCMDISHSDTLPESNIVPEKWWLGDYVPFGEAYFQVVSLFQGGHFFHHSGHVSTIQTSRNITPPRDLFLRRLAVKFTPLAAAP